MTMHIAMPVRTALAVVALGLTAAPPASAMRALEGAVEAGELHVDPGPPGRVRALQCPKCPRSFRLAEDVKLFADGERIPREQLLDRQGRGGTVIYNLESGQAVRLRW